MGVGSQCHTPAAIPLGKTWYPLYRMLGGPQSGSGRVWKISPLAGFNPRISQPVASRYTDYARISMDNGHNHKMFCSHCSGLRPFK
jgi:hypothetical protein